MSASCLHVAVGAIVDHRRVLISRRAAHLHQGGLWEFPGGKLEAGETVLDALTRELNEELGITLTDARPLIRVRHSYPEHEVLLDVWKVVGFTGTPVHCELQPLSWVDRSTLRDYAFPPANLPIISALELPERCAITPVENVAGDWLVEHCCRLERGDLLLLRQPHRDPRAYQAFAREVVPKLNTLGLRVMLTSTRDAVEALGAAGLHLNRQRLRAESSLRRGFGGLLSAACHDAVELALAEQVGVDFALLSPVLPTPSHPGADPLGWASFRGLTDRAAFPVYALGGMKASDQTHAWQHGAQGVAGISMFWGD
ncbi:MAG: Nudix family hydrolase [Thiotrichales bacterium]